VDAEPPSVNETVPRPNSTAAPTEVELALADPGNAGLDPASLRLTLNGTNLPVNRVSVSDDGSLTRVFASLDGLVFKDREKISCEVRAADRVGNRLPTPFRWQWTFGQSFDKTPPTIPALVAPEPSEWNQDFESPSDEWRPLRGAAWTELALDESTASTGKRCLRIEGGPGPYRCYVRRRPFDVRAWPILTFDYLADESSKWDLAFETDKGWWVVRVNGGARYWPVVGSVLSHQPDGEWHRVAVPIGKRLAYARAYSEPIVKSVAVVASNLRGGQTSVLRLDAMRLVPAVFARRDLELKWTAADVSGVEGYSVALDRDPETMPEAKVMTESAEWTFPNLPLSPVFFHCRALDRAGNWGPTLHQQIAVQRVADPEPPKLVSLWPPSGSRTAADAIRIQIEDQGAGVSAERLRLVVARTTFTAGDPELRFTPAQNLIEWRPATSLPAFGDGAQVECKLHAADYAGNAIEKPVTWSWTMSFSQDETPPSAPYISWVPDGALVHTDFERGPGQWMGRREGWAAVTDKHAATGTRCISFGGFSAFAQYEQFDASQFPIVGFDYRLEPGSQFNLMARLENRNWEIRFSSDGAKYPHIGAIEDVLADGEWHSCRFNLAEMLRTAPMPPRAALVDHIATLNRTRQAFHVDNFFIAPAHTNGVRILWSVPRDPTGIKGYSFVLDESPATVPDTEVDGTGTEKKYTGLKPGPKYFHLRACDGTGNWGPTAHMRIELPKAASH